MSNFTEIMESNPPRMVVLFRQEEGGNEEFQWGVVGQIPILSLIGYIIKVQEEVIRGAWIPDFPNVQPALVITYDPFNRDFTHFIHPDIPAESMCGMLELIKQMLVASRMGQQAASQRVGIDGKIQILGPDGTPMRY